MNKVYIILHDTDITQLEKRVNSALSAGGDLVGGPLHFAGMVCQAMMCVLSPRKETPNEPATERNDS